MKKRLTRLISGALMLLMIFTMVAPLTLFAADGDTATVAEDRCVFRETFASDSKTAYINPSASDYNSIIAANGLWVCTQSGSVATLENDTLKYTTRVSGDYIDLRFYTTTSKGKPVVYPQHDLAQSFILSFWVKPSTDNQAFQFSWSDTTCKNEAGDTISEGKSAFEITGGSFKIGGVVYDNAKLPANEWSLVEIVYNYDATEVSDSSTGASGAIVSYNFMLNGKLIKDADGNVVSVEPAAKYHNINNFRLFRYAGTTLYELDDLTIATGTESLIHTISKAPTAKDYVAPEVLPEVVYKQDFSKEIEVNKTVDEKGFWLSGNANGSEYTFEEGTLKYITKKKNDYFDLRFYAESVYIDLRQDFVLSMWVMPLVDDLGFSLTFLDRYIDGQFSGTAATAAESPFYISGNYYFINGNKQTNAKLNKGEWSLVEVVLHYTDGADSLAGAGAGGFTSYSFLLNGELIGTAEATNVFYNIDRFRFVQFGTTAFAIDDITIAYSNTTLKDTIISPAAKVNGYTLNLEGDIGVNAYVGINDKLVSNIEDVTAKFTVDGVTTEQKLDPASLTENGYKVSCDVNATQMTSKIGIELYCSETLISSVETSVADYAKTIMTEDAYANARGVVKAMLNYGGLSQEYFGIEAENPAADYKYTDELAAVTRDVIAEKSVNKKNGSVEGLAYAGSWVELRSTLVLYHAFTVNGDISDYTFTFGDETLEPIYMGGNTYAVAVTEIYAQDMATEYAITVNGTYTLTYNALNYLKLAYSDASLTELVSALYLYYAQAYDYFN